MNEIMQGYLTQLMETVKAGTNFIMGELPKVAQEILAFGIQTDIFIICQMLFLVGVFFVGFLIASKLLEKEVITHKDTHWSEDGSACLRFKRMFFSVAMLMTLVSLTVIPCCVYDIIKINTAPRLYLIEYIGDFIKK